METVVSILLICYLVMTSAARGGNRGMVVIYWGTYKEEGTLRSACETGNYGIVVLSFLSVFGHGRVPQLELADHCDGKDRCAPVGEDVKLCQSRGVKVFLSLGGAEGNYSIDSERDAAQVADYLWNAFLGGNISNSSNSSRPLGGDVVLDGIDFDMEMRAGEGYAHLAKQIKLVASKNKSSKRVYLSAAPQCPYPDEFLGSALKTGLFDYVWVQFYNNPPCHYLPNKSLDHVLAAWKTWERRVSGGKLLFGLPASLSGATDHPSTKDGYMPSEVLVKQVLPHIKQSSRYGGVMLWSYFYDMVLHDGEKVPYSTTIRTHV